MFQSSPALSDERYEKLGLVIGDQESFQSSPALSDERYGR